MSGVTLVSFTLNVVDSQHDLTPVPPAFGEINLLVDDISDATPGDSRTFTTPFHFNGNDASIIATGLGGDLLFNSFADYYHFASMDMFSFQFTLVPSGSGWSTVIDPIYSELTGDVGSRLLIFQQSITIRNSSGTPIGKYLVQLIMVEGTATILYRHYYGNLSGAAGALNISGNGYTGVPIDSVLFDYSQPYPSQFDRRAILFGRFFGAEPSGYIIRRFSSDTEWSSTRQAYETVLCGEVPQLSGAGFWDYDVANGTVIGGSTSFADQQASFQPSVITPNTYTVNVAPTTTLPNTTGFHAGNLTNATVSATIFGITSTSTTQPKEQQAYIRADTTTGTQVILSNGDKGTADTLNWELLIVDGEYVMRIRDAVTGLWREISTTGQQAAADRGTWVKIIFSWLPGQLMSISRFQNVMVSTNTDVPTLVSNAEPGGRLGSRRCNGVNQNHFNGAIQRVGTFPVPTAMAPQTLASIQANFPAPVLDTPLAQQCTEYVQGEGIPSSLNTITYGVTAGANAYLARGEGRLLVEVRSGQGGPLIASNFIDIGTTNDRTVFRSTLTPLISAGFPEPIRGGSPLWCYYRQWGEGWDAQVYDSGTVPFLVVGAYHSPANGYVTSFADPVTLTFVADGPIAVGSVVVTLTNPGGSPIGITSFTVDAVNGLIYITLPHSQFAGTGDAMINVSYLHTDSLCSHSGSVGVGLVSGTPSGASTGAGNWATTMDATITNTFSGFVTGDPPPAINDPVSPFNGAFEMTVTDLRIPGRGIDFVWSRSYSSNITYHHAASMGAAWQPSYQSRLIQVPGGHIDYIAGGRRDRYLSVDGVTWQPAPHHYLSLVRSALLTEFTMTGDGEMKTVFHDFTTATPGKLKRIEDRFGNKLEFLYNGSGLLSTVIDTFGRQITLGHDSAGRVTSVTDFLGRSVVYDYYSYTDLGGTEGQLKSVKAPEVTGTSTGNDFAGANRKTTTYTYNRFAVNQRLWNGILTVKDGKGQVYLTNTFHPTQATSNLLFGRVIRQVYGTGTFHNHWEQITPAGPDGETLVCVASDRRGVVKHIYMNPLGNPVKVRDYTGFANPAQPTTLVSNLPAGKLRTSDPDYFETRTGHDSQGKPTLSTLPRGNTVTTAYNADATERHGQDNPETITRNVGAVGGPVTTLTTSMTYAESNFHLVKTLTDPKGFQTQYFYDFDEATLGDLNGDGVTNGTKGLLVKILHPTVTVGLSATENGGSQIVSSLFRYNAFGQMILHIDGEGNEIEYLYHPENDPDGDGQNIIAGRDPVTGGYLRKVIVDPSGLALTTEYFYDRVGNVTSIKDPRGKITTYEVNQLNQVVKISSPQMNLFAADAGAVYDKKFIYDANDNVTAIRTELQNSQDDSIANVATFSDPNAFETEFAYDILDNVLSRRVEVGTSGVFTGYQEALTQYLYDASENLRMIIHPNADADAFAYDERDLMFTSTIGDADSIVAKSITTQDYDLNGNLAKSTLSQALHFEQFTYDGFDRALTQFVGGTNTTATYAYDANSNVTSVRIDGPKDGSGAVVRLSESATLFDELNRPYEATQQLFKHADQSGLQGGTLTQAVSRVKYNRNSLVVKTVNPRSHASLMSYDDANRLKTATDALGNVMENFFEDGINVTKVTTTEINPTGGPSTFNLFYQFDELNRLRRTEDDLQNVTQITLDSRGLPKIVLDAEGNERGLYFEGRGLKFNEYRQTRAPSDFVVLGWQFDNRSRLVKTIDGEDKETQFQFDSHARLKLRVNADTTTRAYIWDAEDNLEEVTRENGNVVRLAHDNAGRPTSRSHFTDAQAGLPEIMDLFEYNGLNALALVSRQGGGSMSYTRESRNLPLTSTQAIAGFTPKTFTLDYNEVGNPTSMSYPNGRAVNYQNYNAIELVGAITATGHTSLVDYTYAGYGRVSRRSFANGIDLEVKFDAVKRVKEYLHRNLSASKVQAGFLETYDKVHNRRSEIFMDDDLP
ncbi:MAG: DUF6531 domain-containing protein [Planctomycetota bacterium]